MESFCFLYPIPEIIDHEIKNNGWHKKGGIKEFRADYKEKINKCIDIRYRKNNFLINYAIFNGHEISDVIKLKESDNLIEVGLNFKTHTTKQPNGKYPYPNEDFILNQIGDIKSIRIAGFHMWDCVQKLAKKAYERGLNVLVDEDLTEFFSGRISDPDFKFDEYPTYDPRKFGEQGFELFMKARKNRPWLWQDY